MPDLSRRSFIKALAAVATFAVLPIRWAWDRLTVPTFLIAAPDASPESKATADYAMTPGEMLNEIWDQLDLSNGARLELTEGTYRFSDAIDSDGKPWS